jgi:hypothetical protein
LLNFCSFIRLAFHENKGLHISPAFFPAEIIRGPASSISFDLWEQISLLISPYLLISTASLKNHCSFTSASVQTMPVIKTAGIKVQLA